MPLPLHLPSLTLPSLAAALLFLLLSPSLVSSNYFTLECGEAPTGVYSTSCVGATGLVSRAPWTPRSQAFQFEWNGAIWIAGGKGAPTSGTDPVMLSDVWGSYDLGRSWVQTASLPNPAVCTSATGQATVIGGQVIFFCTGLLVPSGSGNCRHHGSTDSHSHYTWSSSSPTLASWTPVSSYRNSDGYEGRIDFSTDVMAVPFDGVGTIVNIGGYNTAVTPNTLMNDVWTYSTTGNFPSAAPRNTWYKLPGNAPWTPRMQHSTVTDAERLVLIMTGGLTTSGSGYVALNDVWQLSFQLTTQTPLWYRLTSTPGFSPRRYAALYAVHDWLFLYGGATSAASLTTIGGNVDDVWQSPDYGTTWLQAAVVGTGSARHGVAGLSVSRRLFVVGGSLGDDYTNQTYANDVQVAYW